MQGAWSLGEKNIASKWNLMLCFSSFPEAAIFPVRFEWINHLLILEATESTHPPPLPFLNFKDAAAVYDNLSGFWNNRQA